MHPTPQRVVLALLAATAVSVPQSAAQDAAGAQLWRLVVATLPLPPALAGGATGAFWNPGQHHGPGDLVTGFEIVRTPTSIGAEGFLGAAHRRVGSLGHIGLLYGRMQITDLMRTDLSPEAVSGSIPYEAVSIGATWTRPLALGTAGLAVHMQENRLDTMHSRRWTVDGGIQQRWGRLRVGAATHLLTALHSDAAHDVFAGVGVRVWEGEAWAGSRRASVELRYGTSFGRGYAADHQVGVGIALGRTLGVDAMVVREASYGIAAWRPAVGVRLHVGRYVVTLAGDGGVNDVGAAYRVGLEVTLP